MCVDISDSKPISLIAVNNLSDSVCLCDNLDYPNSSELPTLSVTSGENGRRVNMGYSKSSSRLCSLDFSMCIPSSDYI